MAALREVDVDSVSEGLMGASKSVVDGVDPVHMCYTERPVSVRLYGMGSGGELHRSISNGARIVWTAASHMETVGLLRRISHTW